MDYLTHQLEKVEAIYLDRFYIACKDFFSGCHMPSHDHTHHLRVWDYCKQLLRHAVLQGYTFHKDFVEALLAAALFHDIGLSRIADERHGPEGAELFIKFIADNDDIKLKLFDEIVEAICVHDLKSPSSLKEAFDLASILTICDNLDSFGYIGAYRYAEIYLIRGITESEIAERSLKNIEKRFSGFTLHYAQLTDFYEQQKKRYLAALGIFKDEQAMNEIMEAVVKFSLAKQMNTSEVALIYYKSGKHPFWQYLLHELRTFNVEESLK